MNNRNDYAGHYTLIAKDQPSFEDVQRFRLDRFPRWLHSMRRDAHILDAGCADGYLLGLLHHFGFHNLSGVELSEDLASLAIARLPPTIQVKQSSIQEFLKGTADNAFDVITFHHVIEHLDRDEVVGVLAELRRCLRPNGRLAIRTPNASNLMSANYIYGDFTHRIAFTETSLTQALRLAGFETIESSLRPPLLFSPVIDPWRAMLRVANLLRWHANAVGHKLLFAATGVVPAPRITDPELEIISSKI